MKREWIYPNSPLEAREIQKEMAQSAVLEDDFQQPLSLVGGMDVSNNRFDAEQMVFAAQVVLSYPDLRVLETATQAERQTFPYIPGLLGFREAPALVHAFEKLTLRPDLICVDGHGVSHPRGMGIATHLGLLLDIPTIGVAKSILVGSIEGDLGLEAGSQAPLMWRGKEIARAVRTKKRCSPLIISAGHRMSLTTAVELVMAMIRGYRLPEPTRHAHLAANVCRKEQGRLSLEKRE